MRRPLVPVLRSPRVGVAVAAIPAPSVGGRARFRGRVSLSLAEGSGLPSGAGCGVPEPLIVPRGAAGADPSAGATGTSSRVPRPPRLGPGVAGEGAGEETTGRGRV